MSILEIPSPAIPGQVSRVLRSLEKSGYEAYLVGGCVRDTVIGRPVHDWDVATSASPDAVAAIFKRTFLTGVRFGTVTVVEESECGHSPFCIEVTSYRSDGKYSDGRRPDAIRPAASIAEDLSRRDFTVNAMAVSSDGVIVDPFGGFEDAQNRLIRCVGKPDARFEEDALRMFRAFRFSAQLGFSIEPGSLDAIREYAGRAKLISAERIRVELEKTILSRNPEIAGEMMDAGLLDAYSNQGAGSRNAPKPRLALIAALPAEPALRWCVFCDILIECGFIISCAVFLRSLRLDRKTVRDCSKGAEIAGSIIEASEAEHPGLCVQTRRLLKGLLSKHGISAVRCAAAVVDTRKKETQKTALSTPLPLFHEGQQWQNGEGTGAYRLLASVDEIVAGGECFSLKDLSVCGHDLIALGIPLGHDIRIILDRMLDHVIEHPEDNKREVLLAAIATTLPVR